MTLELNTGRVSGSDFDYSRWLSTLTPAQKALVSDLVSPNLKVAVSAAEKLLGRKIGHEDPIVKDFFASRHSMTAQNFAALLVLEHQIEDDVNRLSSELGPLPVDLTLKYEF